MIDVGRPAMVRAGKHERISGKLHSMPAAGGRKRLRAARPLQ